MPAVEKPQFNRDKNIRRQSGKQRDLPRMKGDGRIAEPAEHARSATELEPAGRSPSDWPPNTWWP